MAFTGRADTEPGWSAYKACILSHLPNDMVLPAVAYECSESSILEPRKTHAVLILMFSGSLQAAIPH